MELERWEWIERLYHAKLEGANPKRLGRMAHMITERATSLPELVRGRPPV
jgi:hypothetical protein